MKYFFCLVPASDNNGTNIGRTYAYKNRDKWIEGPAKTCEYLTAGYVKGVDYINYNGKAYTLMKTILDPIESFVVIICLESVAGCDN